MSIHKIDTERLVRDFLAAVNSLKTPDPALACSASPQQEREPESCQVSEIDAPESESLEESIECSDDSEDEEDEIGLDNHQIFEEFSNDHELLERLKVTPAELQTLSNPSLFGSLKSKADLLFILRQIRPESTPDDAKPTVLNSPPAPDERIEQSPRDFKAMTERIRRAALARLEQPAQKSAWSWSHMWRRPRATPA